MNVSSYLGGTVSMNSSTKPPFCITQEQFGKMLSVGPGPDSRLVGRFVVRPEGGLGAVLLDMDTKTIIGAYDHGKWSSTWIDNTHEKSWLTWNQCRRILRHLFNADEYGLIVRSIPMEWRCANSYYARVYVQDGTLCGMHQDTPIWEVPLHGPNWGIVRVINDWPWIYLMGDSSRTQPRRRKEWLSWTKAVSTMPETHETLPFISYDDISTTEWFRAIQQEIPFWWRVLFEDYATEQTVSMRVSDNIVCGYYRGYLAWELHIPTWVRDADVQLM